MTLYNAQVHRLTFTTTFSRVLSHQLAGPRTLNPASAIPDDMTNPPEPVSFPNLLLRQLDVLCKQTDGKLRISQSRYKRQLLGNFPTHAPIPPGTTRLFDRLAAQMTESSRMENVHLTNLLPKTVGPFKFVAVAPDTITMDWNGIHNT